MTWALRVRHEFLALGRDINLRLRHGWAGAGRFWVATRGGGGVGALGRGARRTGAWLSLCACDRVAADAAARDMVLVSQPRFEVATWFSLEGVATWFDVATWAFGCGNVRCRDIFEVATWVAVWEVVTLILVSRLRNPTVGRNEVATWN